MEPEPDEWLFSLWRKVIDEVKDYEEHSEGWYASGHRAYSSYDDYHVCCEDAKQGNERAKKYLAKFLELRMRG